MLSLVNTGYSHTFLNLLYFFQLLYYELSASYTHWLLIFTLFTYSFSLSYLTYLTYSFTLFYVVYFLSATNSLFVLHCLEPLLLLNFPRPGTTGSCYNITISILSFAFRPWLHLRNIVLVANPFTVSLLVSVGLHTVHRLVTSVPSSQYVCFNIVYSLVLVPLLFRYLLYYRWRSTVESLLFLLHLSFFYYFFSSYIRSFSCSFR